MPLVRVLPPEEVAAAVDDHGRIRVDELRDELGVDHDHHLATALLELVERGEVAVFPTGEVAVVKPVD